MKCKAITKKKKPCPFQVEPWRTNGLCHIHDPDGTFRQQVKSGATSAMRKASKSHEHTYYMREAGITCTQCGQIWNSRAND